MKPLLTVVAAALSIAAGASQAQSQGVTKDEILVGSIQDLSGPIAAFGKATRQGMVLRVDEINEQGGIHGRKIKLIVEDDGYDPKKAVLAAQKLVNQDKIFIMAGAHRHGAEQRGDADPVREEHRQLHAGDRGARDVRAAEPAEVLVRGDLLRPDAHLAAEDGEGKGREEGLHASTRTTSSVWRCMRGAEAGLKTHQHGTGRERPPTSAVRPISPRRWRR